MYFRRNNVKASRSRSRGRLAWRFYFSEPCKNLQIACYLKGWIVKNYSLLVLFYADPLQVGVTVEAPKDTKDAADQDLPLQRSIKRTNISVLAMTGNIATWHPKNTNIPTRERKCLVPGVSVGRWAGLPTATSRPAGKSTTKTGTTTIPQKDIPQNAGETATLVRGGSATINTGDNKGRSRRGNWAL